MIIIMWAVMGVCLLTGPSPAAIGAPLASVYVKFISPPHIYEHELTTDGEHTISQKSFLAVGNQRPSSQLGDSWPVGVFLKPDVNIVNNLDHHHPHDFTNGLAYPDPFLRIGKDATTAVRFLYSRGGLYFHEIPHLSALLRNQEARKRNGLPPHILSSIRPFSPFYRKN